MNSTQSQTLEISSQATVGTYLNTWTVVPIVLPHDSTHYHISDSQCAIVSRSQTWPNQLGN